jgi:hypothetical protein
MLSYSNEYIEKSVIEVYEKERVIKFENPQAFPLR